MATEDYGLVLLDIQLLGGSGFDLLPDIKPGARVIFVTAHDDYALRAFEVNALDYLLKPVTAERLAHALARVAPAGPSAFRVDDLVHLACGPRSRFVPVAQLSVIEAATAGCLVRRTLKTWEEILPPENFMRVHRAAIVNLARITGYERDAQRSVLL